MRLHIHGIGTLALGVDEPFAPQTGRLENVPIKEYAKPNLRRRQGRLSKMIYIAAMRAIQDAGADPAELAIVGSTALGEATVSLDLLAQIRATRGETISPALVPNSVHNAPAGYLSIGNKNLRPSITVSQGWLSAEAGLAAAADLLKLGAAEQVLVLCGDEADPSWAERLEGAGAPKWAARIRDEAFQEGAVALVVGTEPCNRGLGSLVAGVARATINQNGLISVLRANSIRPGPDTSYRVRQGAGGSLLRGVLADSLNIDREKIILDGPGPGTAQIGSIFALIGHIGQNISRELLTVGAEQDELAFLHWIL